MGGYGVRVRLSTWWKPAMECTNGKYAIIREQTFCAVSTG